MAGARDMGLRGINLTVPHKLLALEIVDELDAEARKLGAVNTVWLEGGKLRGDNTDAIGFLANLDAEVPGWDGSYGQLALKLSEAADGLADHIATMLGAVEKK